MVIAKLEENMESVKISRTLLKRLPIYLNHLKNIPGDFPKVMKLKINGKNPEWQNVSVSPYRWFSKAKPGNSGSISTKGWPEGDYCISITGLFREKAKGNLKTDVYRGSHLLFTLEK